MAIQLWMSLLFIPLAMICIKADLKEYIHVAFNISNIYKLMSKIYYNLYDKRFIDYQFNRFAKKATADHLGINFGDIKFLHKMATQNSE